MIAGPIFTRVHGGARTWEEIEASLGVAALDVLAAEGAAGQRAVGQQPHVGLPRSAALRQIRLEAAPHLGPIQMPHSAIQILVYPNQHIWKES